MAGRMESGGDEVAEAHDVQIIDLPLAVRMPFFDLMQRPLETLLRGEQELHSLSHLFSVLLLLTLPLTIPIRPSPPALPPPSPALGIALNNFHAT